MMLNIHDTQQRKAVELKPMKDNTLRMYTCGPTVYNYAHIGNFRTYVFEDLLRRTIKYFGMKIHHVMNITDVEDKTCKGAKEAGVSLDEYTKTYIDAFFSDLDVLNIERAEDYPRATNYIDKMIDMVSNLIEKKAAYVSGNGSVFFNLDSFDNYGKLSGIKLAELRQGESKRIQSDEYEKENPCDFVLWKAYDEARDGDIKWSSPWGEGRPGWHLECSVMAIQILGETIDLHVGGVDNIFPHHENEIAQSECCTGKQFSRHWMHSAHLLVDGQKMSKSSGNFYTLRDILDKGFTGREVRYVLLSTHYRMQLNFTFDGLEAARTSLQRIDNFMERVGSLEGDDTLDVNELLRDVKGEIDQCLGDDLNISGLLGALFIMIRKVNTLLDVNQIGKEGGQKLVAYMQNLDTVLGVITPQKVEIPSWISKALVDRETARSEKEWKKADEIRDTILNAGFEIEDKDGTVRVKPLK